MPEPDEGAALRAEVAELRGEVERLRSWQNGHICAPGGACTCATVSPVCTWAPCPVHSAVPSQPSCTCGTSVRCYRHCPADWQWPTIVNWYPTMGAGCPPVQTFTLNQPSAEVYSIGFQTTGCAAGTSPAVTFNVPG